MPVPTSTSPSTAAPPREARSERAPRPRRAPLYTEEQRRRRNASKWTLVQGILAPLQLLVCLVSAVLVVRYLRNGEGLAAANVSVLVKTAVLYTIMVTGAIWEKEVFGQYLFAEPFFWEDVVSFLVIALHTAYVWGLIAAWPPRQLMWIALAAYGVYVINATQFLLKLRAARLAEAERAVDGAAALA
jgi:3-vinyl bacteriochlorophyllide hydratase